MLAIINRLANLNISRVLILSLATAAFKLLIRNCKLCFFRAQHLCCSRGRGEHHHGSSLVLSKHHRAQLPQAHRLGAIAGIVLSRPYLSPSLGAPSPALQVKKLKPREVKQFGSSHTAAKDPESVGPDSCGLTAQPPLSRALHTHSLLSGKPTATALKFLPGRGRHLALGIRDTRL